VKKLYKNRAEQQDAYRDRQRAKQETAADLADATATIKRLNLCGFSEVAFNTPAQTWLEEVQIHRSWLRALDQPDVFEGESLKELARRTWQALLASEGYGVETDGGSEWVDTENGKQWVRGYGVSYPLFSPSQQHFQVPFDSKRFPEGPFIEGIRDAAKPGWFEENWRSPKDCTGDEPIDISTLPKLPPAPTRKEVKPEPRVPLTPDAPLITGYETPMDKQNKFSGFGTFGIGITGTNPL
jgi:hypothetical protein